MIETLYRIFDGNPKTVVGQCDCGAVRRFRPKPSLGGGNCGCIRKRKLSAMTYKHGLSIVRDPLYLAWRRMHARCDPGDKRHSARYADRGISVCPEWSGESGLGQFMADMGPHPGKGYSLERKNNDAGYSKGNCRWATASEQQRNRRGNAWVEIDGVKQTAPYWCEQFGINLHTFHSRVRVGHSPHEALMMGRH